MTVSTAALIIFIDLEGRQDMIRSLIAATKAPLQDDDVALCERVFHRLTGQRPMSNGEREQLASAILHFYQDGVRNEQSLTRLLMD
ncbi:MAG: hypothetical protein AAAB20_22740 [Rhizobium sp.]|uniref:hypothetical protein n=1 Tax=Rhizobium sp. TaxID=391 RepID=UPI0030EFBACA